LHSSNLYIIILIKKGEGYGQGKNFYRLLNFQLNVINLYGKDFRFAHTGACRTVKPEQAAHLKRCMSHTLLGETNR